MRSYHLLGFLAFVAVSVSAVPLSDISHTSVDFDAATLSLRSDSSRFTLTVHRTDDLVDEDAGTLVAERQVEIQMGFDVKSTGEDNSLLLNGVPVEAGVIGAQVQVQAEMIVNPAKVSLPDGTVSKEMEEDVESAFDVGLVTVEVLVSAVTISVELDAFLPPVPIRRFSLIERVIEINGKSVVQTDIGEQVIYFAPDGEFVGIVENAEWANITPKDERRVLALQSTQSRPLTHVCSSFKGWFKSLPFALKFLIAFAWTTIGMLWGIFLTSRIALLIRGAQKGYRSIDAHNAAESCYSDDVKDVESFSDGLPEYGSTETQDMVPGGGENENDELCK